jgi:hypothetical protein
LVAVAHRHSNARIAASVPRSMIELAILFHPATSIAFTEFARQLLAGAMFWRAEVRCQGPCKEWCLDYLGGTLLFLECLL